MYTIPLLTFVLLLISFIADRKKTLTAFKKGMKQFFNLLPAILSILMIISLLLYLIPQSFFLKYLGPSAGIEGYLIAAIVGAITMIPGFIVYPIAGSLIKSGVSYGVMAVFITTLMMVGIMTIPIEKKFFGIKATLLRNGLSFLGALMIGFFMALIWNYV